MKSDGIQYFFLLKSVCRDIAHSIIKRMPKIKENMIKISEKDLVIHRCFSI